MKEYKRTTKVLLVMIFLSANVLLGYICAVGIRVDQHFAIFYGIINMMIFIYLQSGTLQKAFRSIGGDPAEQIMKVLLAGGMTCMICTQVNESLLLAGTLLLWPLLLVLLAGIFAAVIWKDPKLIRTLSIMTVLTAEYSRLKRGWADHIGYGYGGYVYYIRYIAEITMFFYIFILSFEMEVHPRSGNVRERLTGLFIPEYIDNAEIRKVRLYTVCLSAFAAGAYLIQYIMHMLSYVTVTSAVWTMGAALLLGLLAIHSWECNVSYDHRTVALVVGVRLLGYGFTPDDFMHSQAGNTLILLGVLILALNGLRLAYVIGTGILLGGLIVSTVSGAIFALDSMRLLVDACGDILFTAGLVLLGYGTWSSGARFISDSEEFYILGFEQLEEVQNGGEE